MLLLSHLCGMCSMRARLWDSSCHAWSQESLQGSRCKSMTACGRQMQLMLCHMFTRADTCPIIDPNDPRLGNGVCDQELNVGGGVCKYDGGDCCPVSCKYNPLIIGSCAGGSRSYIPVLMSTTYSRARSSGKCMAVHWCSMKHCVGVHAIALCL